MLAVMLGAASCDRPSGDRARLKLTPIKAEPFETASSSLARKEEQPATVKVRRDKEGVYTWEITGRDVARIIEADRALRKRLTGPVGQ